RIAALLLEHPRVMRATVGVEKLDLGPGGVGVTIERERAGEVAEVHQLYPAAKRDPNAAEGCARGLVLGSLCPAMKPAGFPPHVDARGRHARQPLRGYRGARQVGVTR